ncbi:teichuronic acid biosynthesis glycosyltransferase TuaG [Pedobacter sp. UYP30]|uniref:glycosyltransferase family 2 protein n=1 Tax=Pedobacter sp. UYP30 TaxID=1756400 RepID=UPI0033985BD3
MDKDLISIIMPAYNAAQFITQSIKSVINQTYKNWELIIVDDGSADKTAEIIKAFSNSDIRIKYFYQKNGKQGKARNLGIKNSIGNYIAFLDADDTWTSDKLAVQHEILSKNENIDLIFSQGYNLKNDEISNLNVTIKALWNINNIDEFIKHNQIPILSVLVKKKAIESVNYFNETKNIQNAEDYHLWLKLIIANYTFKSIEDRLFYYRIHTNQSTFESKNLEEPIFYVYKDIFESYNTQQVRQPLFNKIKWLIFNNKFHSRCLEFFIKYFKSKNILISLFIKTAFAKPTSFNKKAIFQLVSLFG